MGVAAATTLMVTPSFRTDKAEKGVLLGQIQDREELRNTAHCSLEKAPRAELHWKCSR